jgi:hypothetical protein
VVSWKKALITKTNSVWQTLFNDILGSFGRSVSTESVRGEVAERLNAAVC